MPPGENIPVSRGWANRKNENVGTERGNREILELLPRPRKKPATPLIYTFTATALQKHEQFQ